MNRADLDQIWADVKANRAILDACPLHDFVPEEPGKFGSRHRCTRCGGTAESLHAFWYRRGIEHGKSTHE